MKQATAIAPATVANVGPGFDVLGFALAEPAVTITAKLLSEEGNHLTITTNIPDIPTEPVDNTAGVAAMSLLAHLRSEASISLHIASTIPVGSGLGSSAASAVASAVAVNALMGSPLKIEDLLSNALDGEAVASGARHADNVAPCLLGGFVAIREHEPADWIHVPVHRTLYYVVVHPHCVVNTKTARKLLPKTIPLAAATQQWGNVATLIAALSAGDAARVGRALEDKIVEPVRAKLIPGYDSVKLAAIEAGALGCTISGSGPSVLALTDSATHAAKICKAMIQAFSEAGLGADGWTGKMTNPGARVL